MHELHDFSFSLMYLLEILGGGGGFMEVGHFIERGVILKLAQQ